MFLVVQKLPTLILVAEAELTMPKEQISKTIPINFFHINFLLKII